MAIESYFEDIADAIRERGGTSATLTPAAMPQAILDIPGGGGTSVQITPAFQGLSYCYVAAEDLYAYNTKTMYLSLFEVSTVSTICLIKKDTVGNRFRAALFLNKTINDFTPYLNTPGSGAVIQGNTQIMEYNDNQIHPVLFSPGSAMTGVIAVFTSSQGLTSNPYVINCDLLV